jgi:hypothetical protein
MGVSASQHAANMNGPMDASETGSNVGSQSAAHSVSDYDDIATLANKFKLLRRENQ